MSDSEECKLLTLENEKLRNNVMLLREAMQAAITQADVSLNLYCSGRAPECQAVYDQCVAALEQTKPEHP